MSAAALAFSVAVSLAAAGATEPAPASQAGLRARPNDPQAALDLGLALYRKDSASLEAQRLLANASLRFPKRHDAHLALLDSFLTRHNLTAATALLQRLRLELDGSDRFALDAVYCLLRRGQLPLARERWQHLAERARRRMPATKAPALEPAETRPAQCAIAEVVFVQGLLAAAARQKAEALQALGFADACGFPALDAPQMGLAADALYALEEYQLARQAYQEIVNHHPDNKGARLGLALCLHFSGQLDAARGELERLIEQQPDYAEAHYYLGAVLLDLKLEDDARARIERALALDARCHRCMAKLALLAFRAGDKEQCQAWVDKATALDPSWIETILVAGMLANQTGRYEVAVRHLSRVVTEFPDHTQAQYQLALAYQRLGDAERSKQHLDIYNRLILEHKAQTLGTRQ
jgi:Flp pilus assembly protein TadD